MGGNPAMHSHEFKGRIAITVSLVRIISLQTVA